MGANAYARGKVMPVLVRVLDVVLLVIRSTFITTRAVIVSPPVVVDVESSETPRPATVGTDQGAATVAPMAGAPATRRQAGQSTGLLVVMSGGAIGPGQAAHGTRLVEAPGVQRAL